MRNRKFWRNVALLVGITGVVAGLAVMPMFSREPAAQATADDKYSVATPAAGKSLVAEVVHFKRQGPVKAQIEADADTAFFPETATISTTISIGDDGNIDGISRSVRDADGTTWTSSVTDSSGRTTKTNHRNSVTETQDAPPEALVPDDPSDNPSLEDTYEHLGWSASGTKTFNGRSVKIYRISTSVPAAPENPGVGIRLPYTDDLDLASFEAEALIDTELNLLLQFTRWAVLGDGSKVVIETRSVMKSKAE